MNIQLLANIIYSFGIYLIISLSFSLIYQVTKFFHLAHAIVISLSAYLLFFFSRQISINTWISILLSLTVSTLIGLLCEILIYRPLRVRKSSSFILLIASIGIYIILQNVVSLIWGDGAKTMRANDMYISKSIFGGYLTNIQIFTIGLSISLFLVFVFFINKTKIGTKIRAVASNANLAEHLGINYNSIIILVFLIGSFLASITGILRAYDTSFSPTVGFQIVLYGIIAMIIGGIMSLQGLFWGSLLLAIAQHIGAYYIDSKWMDAIAYLILILFLIWRPLGFSGKRLKKVEI